MRSDPLVLDILFLLHIGKGWFLESKLSVVVPQAIGISLCNKIDDSTGEFLVIFPLGVFIDTMGLILLTCSLFLLISGLHFIVCSSIDTPLYLFDPWPAFYHRLLYICRFLAKSHVHMPIYVGFWPKVTYIRSCSLNSRIHPPFWWVWCCGKFLGGLWVWLGLP